MRSLALLFFSTVNALYASLFGGPIDGTAWEVQLKKPGFFHWASRRDTLIFENGRAVAAGAAHAGYSPAVYEAVDQDGGTSLRWRFGAASDGADWSGRIQGKRISGAVIMRGPDGKAVRYVFTGKRKTV